MAKKYDTDYKLAELGMAWTFGGGAYVLTPLIGDEILGADESLRVAGDVKDRGVCLPNAPMQPNISSTVG